MTLCSRMRRDAMPDGVRRRIGISACQAVCLQILGSVGELARVSWGMLGADRSARWIRAVGVAEEVRPFWIGERPRVEVESFAGRFDDGQGELVVGEEVTESLTAGASGWIVVDHCHNVEAEIVGVAGDSGRDTVVRCL